MLPKDVLQFIAFIICVAVGIIALEIARSAAFPLPSLPDRPPETPAAHGRIAPLASMP